MHELREKRQQGYVAFFCGCKLIVKQRSGRNNRERNTQRDVSKQDTPARQNRDLHEQSSSGNLVHGNGKDFPTEPRRAAFNRSSTRNKSAVKC